MARYGDAFNSLSDSHVGLMLGQILYGSLLLSILYQILTEG